MTTKLSDDLRQAIEKEGGSPVHAVGAATNVHYVLMRADQYEKIRANTGGEDVSAVTDGAGPRRNVAALARRGS